MARRDPVGIRLITRRGNDWTTRYPLVVEAVNHLQVRSCLSDCEVVCCDARGVTDFHLLRHRRNEPQAFLYAFDLLELNGADLRREPIECARRRYLRRTLAADQVATPSESGEPRRNRRGAVLPR